MGDADDNFYGQVHILGTVFADVKVTHHHGQNSIDTSKTATTTQAASLHSAAVTGQSAFDTAADAVFGSSWYGPRPSQWKASARSWFKATDFSAL